MKHSFTPNPDLEICPPLRRSQNCRWGRQTQPGKSVAINKEQRAYSDPSLYRGSEPFFLTLHTAHQIGALQFQLQKILFITSQKCRDGQQTLISCTSFQILHLQLAVLFQTKSPMSTFSVSGDRILSHIMPRSADDDTVVLSSQHSP